MKPFFTSILYLLVLQLFSHSFIFAQSPTKSDTTQTLFIIEDNGKYGLLDEKGKVWLEVKYDEVVLVQDIQTASSTFYSKLKDSNIRFQNGNFSEQSLFGGKNLLFLHISPQTKGNPHYAPHLMFYKEGDILVHEGGKCYFLDENARPLFDDFYEDATVFQKGIAAVQKNGRVGIPEPSFTVIQKGDVWGIANSNSEIVVEPQYQKIALWQNIDFCLVQTLDDKNSKKGLWGMIDMQGNILVEPQFDEITLTYSNEPLSIKKDGKFGILDQKGNILVPPIYDKVDYIHEFDKAYFQVHQDSRMALLDEKGKVSIDFDNPYKSWDFRLASDLIKVKVNGKFGAVDYQGNWKIRPDYEQIGRIWHRKFVSIIQKTLGNKHLHGLLVRNENTREFEELLPPIYKKIELLKGKVLRLEQKEGWYYYSLHTQQFLNKDPFDELPNYRISSKEGSLSTFRNKKFGLMDTLGNPLAPIKYKSASYFHKDLAKVTLKEKLLLIDTLGQAIDTVSELSFFAENSVLKRFRKNDKYGLVNSKTAKIVMPPQYDEIRGQNMKHPCDFVCLYQFAWIFKNGKQGLINLEGKEFFPPIYSTIQAITLEYKHFIGWKLEKEGKFGLAKKNGEFILKPEYDIIQHFKSNQYLYCKKEKCGFIRIPIEEKLQNELLSKTYSKDAIPHISPRFEAVHKEAHVAFAKQGGKWSILEQNEFGTTGKMILPAQFDTLVVYKPAMQLLIAVQKEGKWGLYGDGLRVIKEIVCDSMPRFFDCYFEVVSKGEKQKIDVYGHILPKGFEEIKAISLQYSVFKQNGKWGLFQNSTATQKLKVVHSAEFEEVAFISTLYSHFKKNGKWGIFFNGSPTQKPQIIHPAEFERIRTSRLHPTGVFVQKEGRKGYFNLENNQIIWSDSDNYVSQVKGAAREWCGTSLFSNQLANQTPPPSMEKSEKAKTFHLISNTLAAVKDTLNNKWGLQNLQTKKWLLKPIYDEYKSEGDALKSFKITPKMAYINRKGKYVWKENGFEMLEE